MNNHTYGQENKQGHAAWVPPTQGNSLPRGCSLLRGSEGKTLTKPIPQICQQKQQRSTVLAELQEGGCVQAQACMERGVWAAVHLLSKLSQLLVRDMAKNHHQPDPL